MSKVLLGEDAFASVSWLPAIWCYREYAVRCNVLIQPEVRKNLRYWLPFLVGLIVIVASGFLIRRSIDPPFGRDLYPGPDASEYAEMARRFAYLEGFGIQVSGAVVPSRYPSLFPLVLSPLVRMMGGDAIRYPAIMALLGSFSILLAGLIGTIISGYRRAGLLLAAMLALSASHIHASHVVMSDILMLVLYEAALILALLHRKQVFTDRPLSGWSILPAGLLAGSIMAVRIPGVTLSIGFGLFYLLLLVRMMRKDARGPGRNYRCLWMALLLLVGAAIPMAFEMLSRKIQFGSVFANAYAYYIPSFRPGSGFNPLSWDWVTSTADDTRAPNWKYYGKLVLGTDDAHQAFKMPWNGALVYAGLAVFLFLSLRRRELGVVLIIIGGPVALLLLHLLYYWQDPRLVLIPVLVALFLVTYLLAVLSDWLAAALRLITPGRTGKYVGVTVFCMAGGALLYQQKNPVDAAIHTPIPLSGMGGEMRRHMQGEIAKLPNSEVPPIVVTNAGTLRVRNLMFPGASSNAPIVLSLTDSIAHDEHVYRITRQDPYGIPEGHKIEMPLTVFTWQAAERRGSGVLEVQPDVLEKLKKHSRRSHVLLLLDGPDEEGDRAIRLWQEKLGWSIRELKPFSRYRLLQATPGPQTAGDEAE